MTWRAICARPYPAGEQLFHDYADHASGGALLEFGFTHFASASEVVPGLANMFRHINQRVLNPRFLNIIASCDAASNICRL
jgi:hypothetical protein